MRVMWSQQTLQLINIAVREDLGESGDVTSPLLPKPEHSVVARVTARQDGVVSGLAIGPYIVAGFAQRLGRRLKFEPADNGTATFIDGDAVCAGQTVATLSGPWAAVLGAERTLLNFLGRMSGVATNTRRYVDAARQGARGAKVFDTRKTVPGWRELDKYSVRMGGGHNHRTGLFDAVLIKDNHIADIPVERLADELRRLIARLPSKLTPQRTTRRIEARRGPVKFIEVEADTFEQYVEICKVDDVDIVLLDNFTPDMLGRATAYRDEIGKKGALELEASGGVTLETIADIAATNVDRISVGALTHSAPNLDFGLDF